MVELGYVSRDRSQYALNLEFYRLGQRIAANNSILEHARPLCRKLMQAVNETVNLCVGLNTEMVVVDQQIPWQTLRLDSIVGSSFPIFLSASGKAYCAFLDELKLLRLLQEIRRENQEIEQKAVDRFLAELESVRVEGLGFDREELFQGLRSISAPIFDCTGNVIATVGCSMPTVRVTPEKSELLAREVANCAAQISRSLGAAPRLFSPYGTGKRDLVLLNCMRSARAPMGQMRKVV